MENSKDKLDHMFEIQRMHNNIWQDENKFNIDADYRLKVIKDFVLGMIEQNSSLLKSVNWGKHQLNRIEDVNNSKIQLIDIIKYAIGMFILLGGDGNSLYKLFVVKSKELDERWRQMFTDITEKTSVVLFDIDGVIADYSLHYENFLKNVCGLVKKEGKRMSYSFFDLYGITRQTEEKFNEDFIKMGGFRNIPVFDGVVDVMKKIKSMGHKIILITARPNWIFKRLAGDTMYWLNENKIPYDMLFWNKDKSDVIINNIFPARIMCMVEDRDKHAIEVSHIGVDVLMINKSYNKGIKDTTKIKRIYKYDDIIRFIKNKDSTI